MTTGEHFWSWFVQSNLLVVLLVLVGLWVAWVVVHLIFGEKPHDWNEIWNPEIWKRTQDRRK